MMAKMMLGAAAAAALGVVACAAPARAEVIYSLGFQEAGVDGGAIQSETASGGTGQLAEQGPYGDFSTDLSIDGSPYLAAPQLSIPSFEVSTAAAGPLTLNLYITEQGLTGFSGAQNLLSTLAAGAWTGSVTSVVETTMIDAANGVFDGTTLDTQTFDAGNLSFSGTASTPDLSGPFSETIELSLTFGGAGDAKGSAGIANAPVVTAVPEPAPLALFGSALVGFAFLARRRTRRS